MKTTLIFGSIDKAISSVIPSTKPGREGGDDTVARTVVGPSRRLMGPHTTVCRVLAPALTRWPLCPSMASGNLLSPGSSDYPGIQWTDGFTKPFYLLNTSIPIVCKAMKLLNSRPMRFAPSSIARRGSHGCSLHWRSLQGSGLEWLWGAEAIGM